MHRTDVMIDIETLGNRATSIPVTIGVAAFSLEGDEVVHDKFQIHVHPGTAQKAGLTMDAGTIMWWMAQSPEAQASLISKSAISLNQALTKLTEYICKIREKNFRMKLNIWGNDPDFDMVILGNAYRALGQEPPWQFWETRSTRTMVELAERLWNFDRKRDFVREGTHHDAADDAEHQAKLVRHIYDRLRTGVQEVKVAGAA